MRASTADRRTTLAAIAAFAFLAVVSCATTTRGQAILLGEPFGVASVRVPLSDPASASLYASGGLMLTERGGRAHYPTLNNTGLLERLGENLLQIELPPPSSVEMLFLFQGTEPLDLTIYTPSPRKIRLEPTSERPVVANRLLQRWWRAYYTAARQQARSGDYPATVNNYLLMMLANRLRLSPPLLSQLNRDNSSSWPRSIELLAGTQNLREAAMRATMQGSRPADLRADRPIPSEPEWQELTIPEAAADTAIEPIAMHVPEECFYIRFGTFENYLWFRDFLRESGGDLARLFTLRGTDMELDKRLQRQLAVSDSVLVDLFGARVASDVALIGRDLFFREGPALGVVLVAKNTQMLGTGLRQQRQEALAAEKTNGAKLETVTISGREVSFLSTPDNRLRSFYVVDGDYHLVTTSRTIVERFLAAGQGERPLGAAAEFRSARTQMPLEQQHTLFAYFSATFFQGLFSPQYQIELPRRLQAVTDLELVQLARLAAKSESKPSESIGELVAAGFLPEGFGSRADESSPLLESDRAVDSMRGARGSFLPVPDVALSGATEKEAAEYAEHAAEYRNGWRQLDPLLVAVGRRDGGAKGKEHITIDANLSPLSEEKYGILLSLLGDPEPRRVALGPKNLISIEASVRGGTAFPGVLPHCLFLGLEDLPVVADPTADNALKWLRFAQKAPTLLGAWPAPGFLDRLPINLVGEPDADGFSELPLGLLRWQGRDFSLLSFHRPVLDSVIPSLKLEDAEAPAQIRVHASDLSNSTLVPWLNSLYEQKAREVALANVRLLHSLSNQLSVPRERALDAARGLLDTQLVPLPGGAYQLAANDGGCSNWQATGWKKDEDRTAPILKWFRGLELNVRKDGKQLTMHAELDMQRQAAAASKLQIFENLFNGKSAEKQTPKDAAP